jgi:hypothetical protein
MKDESIARVARTSTRAIALAGCFAVLSGGLVAQRTAHADATVTASPAKLFSVHPVEEGSTTLPGGHFNYALVPGQHISDGIVVENLSSGVLTFQLYGADLITAIGGGLAPAQPTATMRAVGAWITVATPVVTVAAHMSFTDGFTLAVPVVVSPGQHLGALVVSAVVGTTSKGNPIQARAALITVVSIPGAGHASAALSALTGSTSGAGTKAFAVALSNTGNLLITYAGSIVIVDRDGHRVAHLPLTPGNAYVVPGGLAPLSAVWRDPRPFSGTGHAQATVSVLVNGVAMETLRSQWLEVQSSSDVPVAMIAAISLTVMLLLFVAVHLVRWDMRRRQRSSRVPPATVQKRLA